MSDMPTFSYAQAAKGLSGTPAAAKVTTAQPETSDFKPEEQTNNATTTDPVTTTSESATPRDTEKVATSDNDDSEFTTVTKHSTAGTKPASSRASSPSVGASSSAAPLKDLHASQTINGSSDATSDKQSLADGQTEKQEGGAESVKDNTEDLEKSVLPKELKAAPLPTVNIWQQRKEAQEAKAKAVSALNPAGTATKTASSKPDEGQQDSSKFPKKKVTDGVPDGTKDRKKADGGKGREESLPPVGDASLWPTPQVAQGEEKKKAQEKTEKSEQTSKSPVIRSHGKEKWTPVPYVPTAVFNTPLPSSGRNRGGRAARGGRDGGRGGPHGTGAAAGEKGASALAAQGSTSKQTSGERGRHDSGTGRAASLPAQSRRSTSTDVGPSAEPRKASQPADRNRGARSGEDVNASTSKQANETFARPQREGKSFAKNQGDRNPRGPHLAVDSQAAARANDRRFENGSKSADFYHEPGFSDFNRERGDSRAERGGRGPNRGRGMYSTFGGQNSQFANTPMPNNTFVTPKSFGFNDRQRPQQQGLPNGSQQGGRMPLRSPSLPASASMYGVYPFPADINTMYGYQAVNPGPMSAMPYQQYMEPFSLVTMLSMQLYVSFLCLT